MLPEVEILLILKQLVFQERSLSAKGQKDRIDILSLLIFADLNFPKYKKYLTKFKVVNLKKELEKLISQTVKIPELDVNEHQWSRKKKFLLLAIREKFN